MGNKGGKPAAGERRPSLSIGESAFGEGQSGSTAPSAPSVPSAPPMDGAGGGGAGGGGAARAKSGTQGPPVMVQDTPYFRRHQDQGMGNFRKMPTIDGCPAICQVKDGRGTYVFKHVFDFSLDNKQGGYEVFRVEKYLASGGYAHVFQAKQVLADGGLGQSFAVKFMYKRGDTELKRLADRELQGSYWIKGPNKHECVITVVGSATADKVPEGLGTIAKYGFVVLELGQLGEITEDYIMCEGTDNPAISGRNACAETMRLDEKYLKRIMRDMARGVNFMHQRGVKHRDLKPENMLIDAFGNVKLTDFGLMKTGVPRAVREANDLSTELGTRRIGSESYMSPEMKGIPTVVNGQRKKTNPNEFTDIWSMGVTLCLMYAAALPPTTWARESARDPAFPVRWLRQNGRAHPSAELQEFLGMIFRVKYPSVSNGWKSGAPDVRASAAELLESAWLAGGVATDKEWAEELVRRNAPRVRKGLDAAPKHSKIFMGDHAEFYACLVGAYFRYASKKAGQTSGKAQNAVEFLHVLGLTRVADDGIEDADATLEEAFGDAETIDNLQLDWDENKFLVRALSSAGCDFAWIREKYGGGEALAAALN